MTWRDRIKDAADAVERAKATRTEVFAAAHAAGLSMRQIGDAAGRSAAMVCRDIGGVKVDRVSLDEEAPDGL